MFQLSSTEVATLTLQVELSIAQNSFILVSHLRPESSLLRSRKSAIDALKSFGINSESDLAVLAIIPKERCVLLKASVSGGGSLITAKMKMFLDAYFTNNSTTNNNVANSDGKVSWISEDLTQGILERHNLSTSGKPL